MNVSNGTVTLPFHTNESRIIVLFDSVLVPRIRHQRRVIVKVITLAHTLSKPLHFPFFPSGLKGN